MISKFVIFIVVIGIIYYFILPKFRTKKPQDKIQNFVECSKCKTYADVKDMVIKDGEYVCKDCLCK